MIAEADLDAVIIATPSRLHLEMARDKVFSAAVEDEVYCTLYLPNAVTGQLACNWTDSSYRKMETRLTIWAVAGTRSRTGKELDLLLGLGAKDAFRFFADHVVRRYNADPGFTTMNLPRLLDTLEDVGVVDPIVCANINSVGFRMCGGRALYEETIATRRFRPIAMSVLRSGALVPREAIDYVCRQQNIRSIVFGASSRAE